MEQMAPWVVTFHPDDTLEEKLKKAAHVQPSPAQLAWMEKEYVAFVHYSPNTFNNLQWGTGKEQLTDYRPAKLDVAQWCEVCAAAGMKMMVFTAKHHDGFCQWDTKTTDFSSMNAPAGEDVLRNMQQGCEANGLQLGVYLSPWDMHQRELGLWPEPAYNDYFKAQLRELLENYGKIDEVWFDGACGDYRIWQAVPAYVPEEWYALIRDLQPTAVVRLYDPYFFAGDSQWAALRHGDATLAWSGRGVRWVGNENGKSRENEWSVQPVFDQKISWNATWADLGEEKYYDQAVGAIWYPVEVNTIVLNQWFWNEGTSKVRALSDLINVYYQSIGNNGTLLLNISPDTTGVVPSDQIERLMQLRAYVDETFRENLARSATVAASRETADHGAGYILDGDPMSYWQAGETWRLSADTASLTFELKGEQTFDQVMIQEYIREGQRVAGWMLEVWDGECWNEVIRHKTIGYKSIRRFPKVTVSKVRLTILRSWDTPLLSGFGLYLSAPVAEEAAEPEQWIVVQSADVASETLQHGLRYVSYAGGMQSVASLAAAQDKRPLRNGLADDVNERWAEQESDYALSLTGYLHVPETGTYTFQLECADGGQVYLGEKLLLNNDEPHERSAVARTVSISEGYYAIQVCYTSFRNAGYLRLRWQRPGLALTEVDGGALYHGGQMYCLETDGRW